MKGKDLIRDVNMVSFFLDVDKELIFEWFIDNAELYGYDVYIKNVWDDETSKPSRNFILKKILTNEYYECYAEVSTNTYEGRLILSWMLTPIKKNDGGGVYKSCGCNV